MLITKKSIINGKETTLDVNVTQDQIDAWNNGMLIQKAMPNISNSDREFIMTGITTDEWDNLYTEE